MLERAEHRAGQHGLVSRSFRDRSRDGIASASAFDIRPARGQSAIVDLPLERTSEQIAQTVDQLKLLTPARVVQLLDQMVKIQLGESPLAQQVDCPCGPGEIVLILRSVEFAHRETFFLLIDRRASFRQMPASLIGRVLTSAARSTGVAAGLGGPRCACPPSLSTLQLGRLSLAVSGFLRCAAGAAPDPPGSP